MTTVDLEDIPHFLTTTVLLRRNPTAAAATTTVDPKQALLQLTVVAMVKIVMEAKPAVLEIMDMEVK